MSDSLCTEYSMLLFCTLLLVQSCWVLNTCPRKSILCSPNEHSQRMGVYSFLHLKALFAELKRGWVKLVLNEDTDNIEQVFAYISNAHNCTVLDCIQVAVPWKCTQYTVYTGECRKRGGGHVWQQWRWIFPFSSSVLKGIWYRKRQISYCE